MRPEENEREREEKEAGALTFSFLQDVPRRFPFLFFARFSGLYLFLTHVDGTPCRSVCWPSSPFGTLSGFLFFSSVVEY